LCVIGGAAAVAISSFFCLAADKPAGGKKKILFIRSHLVFDTAWLLDRSPAEPAFAEKMLKDFAGKAGYQVDVTQDPQDVRELKKYDALVLYTTGNPLIDRGALLKWLRDGGALIAFIPPRTRTTMPQRRGADG